MQFKELIGQAHLQSHLISLVNQKKLPHAMMLLQPEGSGGLALAMALAQYIHCENKLPTDSCGQCASCLMIAKLQHPDLHFSFPTYKKEGASKPPVSDDYIAEFREFAMAQPYGNDKDWLSFLKTEKQGNITADECREILRKLQLRAFMSPYKVMIMWYPEYLDTEGNRLLKFIEEPTANTILILVATQLEKVLATIQSRTQLFTLHRLQVAAIQQALIKRGMNEQQALQIAHIADGNYNEALQLSQHSENDMLPLLKRLFNGVYTNKGNEIMQFVQDIAASSRETQKKCITYYLQILEHLVRYKQLGRTHVPLVEDEYKILDNLIARQTTPQQIQQISQLLEKALYHIERNANAKILFHSLSLNIQQLVFTKK